MPGQKRRFVTTQWSLVLAAQDAGSPRAREALARLCEGYWYPLYAYVRRQGHSAEDAQDLTQGFFARLLEKSYLQQVDRDKGRFRSFLLAACGHFLSNERDRVRAVKRGGGAPPLPLDLASAEQRYSIEPAHDLTPEKQFLRQWTLTLLDRVLAALRDELAAKGKAELFESLKPFLTGEDESYAKAAERLGLGVGATRVAVHRLRRRYRQVLREEVLETLDDPQALEDEIQSLLACLE
jgi:RNA polymerase sigma-70 factor (ECF subfamily)